MAKPDLSKPLWLIDASIYVFRAWFTIPETINADGQNVNAVIGFKRFVDDLVQREQPLHIAFAFDESLHHCHRKAIYPEYKANRESAPENLRFQFRLCREYVRANGMLEAASHHYEADDLIATWAVQAKNRPVNIITADKDLAQLVREKDLWWDYQKGLSLDYAAVIKKFGVKPEQMADQLALAGDKADNIPGVPGIGMATAAKLLRRFATLDDMLRSIDEIGKMKFRGAKRTQELIQQYSEKIMLYRKLTRLHASVPDAPQELRIRSQDVEALMQFSTMLKKVM